MAVDSPAVNRTLSSLQMSDLWDAYWTFQTGNFAISHQKKERYCSTYELYFPSEYATDEPKRETNMNSFNINEFYMTRCLQCNMQTYM